MFDRIDIRRVPISQLSPAQYNPRKRLKRSDPEYQAILESIRTFGYVEPIVWNEVTGNIVGGHQRYQVAKDAGETEIDVRVVHFEDLHDEQRLNLALNNVKGQWDDGKLAELLTELQAEEIDLAPTGFNDEDLVRLLGGDDDDEDGDDDGDEDKDDADDARAKIAEPITRLGDIYLLGQHRLICGDAADPEALQHLMHGHQAALVFTDPPYGVSYIAQSGKFDELRNDSRRNDDLLDMLIPAFKLAGRHAWNNAAFYIWHACYTRDDFKHALVAAGLEERQYLIWVKPSFVLGHDDYQWAHEPCFYCGKAGQAPAYYGDRAQSTVWRVAITAAGNRAVVLGNGVLVNDGEGHQLWLTNKLPDKKKLRAIRLGDGEALQIEHTDDQADVWEVARDTTEALHPTQKPVELAARAIRNSSQPGDIVLDMFLGSGTTLIAAELNGRRCFGVELDPKWCDVIVARWEKVTGQKAERLPATEV